MEKILRKPAPVPPTPAAAATPEPATRSSPSAEERSFRDLLLALIGKPVTIVNPESYEDAPVGHQIRHGFHRAKPVGMGRDFLILLTEHKTKGGTEAVRQYLPLDRIKRISVLKSERLIHI